MSYLRNTIICQPFPSLYRPVTWSNSLLQAKCPTMQSMRSLVSSSMKESLELFDYTSGRWIWNDSAKHAERRRVFNVPELKRLAAVAVDRKVEDISRFEKLAEGGFNRTFLITMRDGFQFVGRIPYPVTDPKHLLIASEVATIDYLRLHDIPVPKIYSYSISSKNAAGTEYIFMELVRGTNLGDIWFDLSERARIAVVTKIVELESRLFSLTFPASGSLYHTKDLPAGFKKVDIPTTKIEGDARFCIGTDTRLSLWHGKRLDIKTDRGPYVDAIATLEAGAKKEMAYLTKFGRPLHPFQRLRREIYSYEKQPPSEHFENLRKYLQVAPHLVPASNRDPLTRPTLRHPDLHPNNIFVSPELDITGLVDWQHSAILPLFLQCGIPNSLQNYGDDVSESLTLPEPPPGFDDLSDSDQFQEVLLLRRRQLHYFYVAMTAGMNPVHYDAMSCDFSTLRRRLFEHVGYPWEGDNVTLKADLIQLTRVWSDFVGSDSSSSETPCPIIFSADEEKECLRLHAAQIEADEQLQTCRDVVGIGLEGWVPVAQFDETKQRARKLHADALDAAESEEERQQLLEHWIFDDFDEDEYS